MDPYNYLMGGLATQILYDVNVTCAPEELARFTPPENQTCGEYMADFFQTGVGYLVNDAATDVCEYCEFSTGGDYAKTLNYQHNYYGWRDVSLSKQARIRVWK
jgi:ATP-binding cassette subfamily G (WHITE) protein 2 (SNQ2)